MLNDFSTMDAQSELCQLIQVQTCELQPALEPALEFESARSYQLSTDFKADWLAGKIY